MKSLSQHVAPRGGHNVKLLIFLRIVVICIVSIYIYITWSSAIARFVRRLIHPPYEKGLIVGPSVYGGDTFGGRYYPETQITPQNVASLQMEWDYSSGDGKSASVQGQLASSIGFECSPIICHHHLIVVTPTEALVALDPSSGEQLWRFEPPNYTTLAQVSRGAACWSGPQNDPHPNRILYTCRSTFCEVDADTGKLIESFGNHGVIDLAAGVGRGHPEMVRYNSPCMIVGDTAVCGSAIDDDVRADSPSGEVRAFDIHTGQVKWSWDMIPRDKLDPARKTWGGDSADKTGSGNVWSMMSYDAPRHLIYLPTSSPANDEYGGTRVGDNHYCNSIVCLNADKGTMIWFYQLVHHDLWDADIPAEPLLFDFHKQGETIPAVAVATKMGRVFLFNRVTGVPLFPIREVPVPQTDVPGEVTSLTQPLQDLPPPLVPQTLSPDDAWGPNPDAEKAAYHYLSAFRTGPIFTPPSLVGNTHNPGRYGGCNWAGMAYDQKDALIITTVTNAPFYQKLVTQNENARTNKVFPMYGSPYGVDIAELSLNGFPVIKPPWGKIVAIDPATGQIRWQHPVGYIPEAEAAHLSGYEQMGSPVVGGAITSASGLTFLAGTRDQHLRVFSSATGREIVSFPLPSVGASLPMIYTVNGREYIVICSGGHGFLRSSVNDIVMAFSLPTDWLKKHN